MHCHKRCIFGVYDTLPAQYTPNVFPVFVFLCYALPCGRDKIGLISPHRFHLVMDLMFIFKGNPSF
jgi:hypothetical protein